MGYFLVFCEDKKMSQCNLCSKSIKINEASSTSSLKRHLITIHSIEETYIDGLNSKIKKKENTNDKITFLRKDDSETITPIIMEMLVKDFHPFTLVEEYGFKKLLNYLAPRYKISNRKRLANNLLDKQFNFVFNKLKQDLAIAEEIVITCDFWSTPCRDRIFSLTANFQ